MATIMFGSARYDENGRATGGAAGDSLQKTSTNDTVGEVSMCPMYTPSQGWYIFRPKQVAHANAMKERMIAACNNKNIGYGQDDRYGVVTHGIDAKIPIECDCSSLVRRVIMEATGKDPGDFSTANEPEKLEATGLFEKKQAYVSQAKTPVYDGDILVTKTKGHTGVITFGNPRPTTTQKVVKATGWAHSLDKSLSGTYKVVNTTWLNVRHSAGANKKYMVAIPEGTAVQCYGYYTNVSGTKWLYVQFTYKEVTYIGFCSSKYLSK